MLDFALHEKLSVVQLFTKLFLYIFVPVYLIRDQHELTHEELTYLVSVVFAQQKLQEALAASRLHFVDEVIALF